MAEKTCKYKKKCGGCKYIDLTNEQQLAEKQKFVNKLLKSYGKVEDIVGMGYPYNYRNKVHAVFGSAKGGKIVCGTYEEKTHRIVDIAECQIEDKVATSIIRDIKELMPSFKIKPYNEDTGYGLLRHVLVRRGFNTGEVMVVLVLGSPVLPSRNNFVKALLKKHPEITTVVQNVNDRNTSMVLGENEKVLYGPGFIVDELMGMRFRISSKSFYQVNPVQTKHLYRQAIELASLTGKERVLDAYCGTGTIGMIASKEAKEVIGVELNRDAVKDARKNAKANGVKNIDFICKDAGDYMLEAAARGEHFDVVIMDPPRSGSTKEFIDSVKKTSPDRVVYISCNPETLARDLKLLTRNYKVERIVPFDMFPFTSHCEVVTCLERIDAGK